AILGESRAAYATAEQSAWLEVRTAWLAVEGAGRRLDLTALTVASAEENLRLANGLFEAGEKFTSVELADATQALAAVRAARAEGIEGVAASGTVQPVQLVQVGTQISGTIEKLLADFNSKVKAGQTVAVLDARRLASVVAQDQAALAKANADVIRVEAVVAQANAEVGRAKAAVAQAKAD